MMYFKSVQDGSAAFKEVPKNLTGGQGVAGSNPAIPTKFPLVDP